MKNKSNLTILSVVLSSTITSIPIYSSITSQINYNLVNVENNKLNISSSKQLNYSHHYAQNNIETISNASGPILLKENGKKIVNNDWYGNENWSLDVSTIDQSSNKIVDWDFMPTHDWIFVLTNSSYLIKINTYNGEVLARASLSNVLSNANKIARIDFNNSLYVWNSNDTSSNIIKLDRNTLVQDNNGITNGKTNGALVNIIPLDVGYSIGVYAENGITDDSSVSKLTLKFIDDNGSKITEGTEQSITFSSKNIKDIALYGFKRKNNANSTLLIVNNKFYEIKLNKSNMSSSTIAEVESKINNSSVTINDVNSAFMDNNEIVYFKEKGGKKIYQIDFNNTLSVFFDLSTSSDNTIKTIANTSDNMLQIFPVITKEQNNISYTNSNIYLSDTDNNHINGIVNKALYSSNSIESLKPSIKFKSNTYEERMKSNVPSIVDQTFFASDNGANVLDVNNVSLTADDINGILKVKALVERKSWFDSSRNTYSIINKEYKASDSGTLKPKKISEQVSWIADNTFASPSWFGKYTPEQIVESDLEKKDNLITIQGVSTNSGNFKNLTKSIAIKERNKSTGKIKLSGVVSYSDKYGNYINFPLPDKEYTIKASSDNSYSLKFYGAKDNANGIKQQNGNEVATNTEISMTNISEGTEAFQLKKYLPSLIDPNDFNKFIEEENNYIPSRRTISRSYDDDKGELTLTITYTGFSVDIPYKFVQKFTGFLTKEEAKIVFNGEDEKRPEIIDKFDTNDKPKDITSITEYNSFKDNVSTEIKAEQLGNIYTSKLDAMGYKPKIKIENLDDKDVEFGSIKVTLDYSEQVGENKKLKEPYKNDFGLKDYKISQRYTGLLPIGVRFKMEINPAKADVIINKYNVDSDIPTTELISTLELKEFEPNEISISAFSWNGEKFEFLATAQSKKYSSVQQSKRFTLDWSPKFKNIRDRNMAIAVSVAIGGTAAISTGIALYILRRNRIRRLLK